MPTTREGAKVGTIEFDTYVHFRIPLADPNALGNMGLDGFDEDTTGDTFPTRAAAQAWVRKVRLQDGQIADHARITEFTWDAYDFRDAEYGLVHDAERRTLTVQYGYPGDDGAWAWGDAEADR